MRYLILATVLVCLSVSPAAAAENPALAETFQKLTTLEQGQGLDFLHPIRRAVVQSRADETVRKDLEVRLIEILQGDTTDLAQDYACRQLVIVGSESSIPVLAKLLPNPRRSAMARYALEGIGSPMAIESLRKMLGKTDGRQRYGVVISLGRLAAGAAVPALVTLLDEEDDELRALVVVALGRIGSPAAAAALLDFAGKAPAGLRDVAVDSQLQAAELLCRRGEYQTAVALVESLLPADSQRVRAAALRGLVAAKPAESLALIIADLSVEDSAAGNSAGEESATEGSWRRAVAADCLRELRKPEDIEAIAAAIQGLPVPGKIAAFIGLEGRSHPAVRQAALVSLEHADVEVRTAALAALIASATANDVAILVDLASADKDIEVRDAALETVRLLAAIETNQALLALLSETKALNRVMVKCALARRSPQFIPVFLRAAQSADAATRLEAFKALAIMATGKEAKLLAGLLAKTSAGEERVAADRAVWMSCQRISDPAKRSAPLLATLEQADVAGQCALLPVLARLGGEGSLAAIGVAMQSKDLAVRDAGFRALANWPDATVADQLLDIAKTSAVESYRIWSLRAYARVVTLPHGRPPQQTFEMLNSAMTLATRSEDKELIVARLGSVRVPDALTRLLSLLDDEQLKDAAVPAIFTLAKGLSHTHPDRARAALEKVKPLTKDAATLLQIPKVLRDIEARQQKQIK